MWIVRLAAILAALSATGKDVVSGLRLTRFLPIRYVVDLEYGGLHNHTHRLHDSTWAGISYTHLEFFVRRQAAIYHYRVVFPDSYIVYYVSLFVQGQLQSEYMSIENAQVALHETTRSGAGEIRCKDSLNDCVVSTKSTKYTSYERIDIKKTCRTAMVRRRRLTFENFREVIGETTQISLTFSYERPIDVLEIMVN